MEVTNPGKQFVEEMSDCQMNPFGGLVSYLDSIEGVSDEH